MEMDRQQDEDKKDLVCVGAQRLLRLLGELWRVIIAVPHLENDERDNRLSTLCLELHKIVKQARPCRHAEHLEDVIGSDGELGRLAQAVHAFIVDWQDKRR